MMMPIMPLYMLKILPPFDEETAHKSDESLTCSLPLETSILDYSLLTRRYRFEGCFRALQRARELSCT